MGRIPDGTRRRVAKRFGFRCPLCSIPFLSYDVHHIKFASMGGIDEDDNLIPLCPSCHRIYGHKLSKSFDQTMLTRIRSESLSLVAIEESIRSYISTRPSDAANLLLLETTHDLILRFGRYHRFLVLSKYIAQNLSAKTVTDRVLKARVLIFSGEMALYSEQELQHVSIVRDSLLTLNQSRELMPILAGAELVSARLAGRTNSFKEEQKFMERGLTHDISVESTLHNEWLFRRIAFYKKKRQYEKALGLASTFKFSSSHDGNVLTSNILSEVARIQLYSGQSELAKKTFKEVLSISVTQFHRRGILITSIFLARANLALLKHSEAAENFLLASQFMDVARSNDKLALEEIQFSLEEELGPHWLIKPAATESDDSH